MFINMPKKSAKKPPVEIARLNKVLPRLELAAALEMTGQIDEMALARLLRSNGESKGQNISTLAAKIGIPYKRVIECYRDSKRLEGIVAVAERLPKVMQDVAIDAESRMLTCVACEGSGRIAIVSDKQGLPAETKMCIPCEGLGKILKSGDAVARKQVMEMMELTGKAPIWAPGSNILNVGESFEDTLRNMRKGADSGANRTSSTIEADQRSLGQNSSRS